MLKIFAAATLLHALLVSHPADAEVIFSRSIPVDLSPGDGSPRPQLQGVFPFPRQ